jgi:site-specific recombinase XerD
VGRKVDPAHWDSSYGRVRESNSRLKELNRYLDELRARVYSIQGFYRNEAIPYTAKIIRDKLLGINKNHRTLLALYQEHNDEIMELVGPEYSRGAYLKHLRTRKHLQGFLRSKMNLEDIYLNDVDLRFITQFEHYLKVNGIGGQNTITKYITSFKKIIRIAYANDWISKDPFYHWKAKWAPVDREALTETELHLPMNFDFENPRLEQVTDIFLFCCFTGLAYADVKKLSGEHLVFGMDGNRWIKTKRTKTDTKSIVPILPAAETILNKYDFKEKAKNNGTLLPVISNQKMNVYLKEIAKSCEINKYLTFHLSRHTFATSLTLTNGVPIESVSRMLGHRSLRTTQIYAKVLDRKLMEDMRKIKKKFGQPDIKKRIPKESHQIKMNI